MIISWLGEAGIRLQTKDAMILIDPPSASTGFKPTRQSADIVALTQSNGRDAKSVGGDPLIIDMPGEYERKNVFVYGVELIPGGRVHWRLAAEDISLAHLADEPRSLENGQAAQFEGVDILFVPVGGKTVLGPEQAAGLVNLIEPRVVVPIQFHVPGSTAGYGQVEPLLKAMGASRTAGLEKWKITKKDLPSEETAVVVLRPT